jgi:hypothetical protein
MSTDIKETKPRASRWLSALLLLILLLLGITLTTVLDEKTLVSNAYGLPMLAFRGITYAMIVIKAPKSRYVPLFTCIAFNELFIYLTYSGAVTLW